MFGVSSKCALRVGMQFYRRFGQALRQARRAAGLSQADLAVAIKLARTSVSNIEQGRQKVLLHTFAEMLRVLKAQPSELLPNRDDRPAPSPDWNGLAHDERDFVRRALHWLPEGDTEGEHGTTSDTGPEDPEYSEGAAEEV